MDVEQSSASAWPARCWSARSRPPGASRRDGTQMHGIRSGTGEKFRDAHCQTKNAEGKFRHVELPVPQELTGTPAHLKKENKR